MKKKIKIISIYAILFIIILFMLGGIVNIFMEAWSDAYTVTHEKIEALPQDFLPDCILIPGAKVHDDSTMSTILTDRVDIGLEVFGHYSENVPLLLSGGDTPGENEINAMHLYVSACGVEDESVLTDGEGVNTYASILRAKEVFNAEKILIVTQDFHLPRAIFIARSLGMEAYGVSSDLHKYYTRNYIREYFARIKDVFSVMLKSS